MTSICLRKICRNNSVCILESSLQRQSGKLKKKKKKKQGSGWCESGCAKLQVWYNDNLDNEDEDCKENGKPKNHLTCRNNKHAKLRIREG